MESESPIFVNIYSLKHFYFSQRDWTPVPWQPKHRLLPQIISCLFAPPKDKHSQSLITKFHMKKKTIQLLGSCIFGGFLVLLCVLDLSVAAWVFAGPIRAPASAHRLTCRVVPGFLRLRFGCVLWTLTNESLSSSSQGRHISWEEVCVLVFGYPAVEPPCEDLDFFEFSSLMVFPLLERFQFFTFVHPIKGFLFSALRCICIWVLTWF